MPDMPAQPLEGGNFADQIFVTHAGYSSGFNRTPVLSSLIAVPKNGAGAAPGANPVD
jgi:hypothetical protein